MLEYPSIPHCRNSPLGKPCYAFVKYDGSNLRWEWSPKKGWYKQGTRTSLFDKNTKLWSQAIPIFHEVMADVIAVAIKEEFKGVQHVTAFTEFFGPSSFAGNHDEGETKRLVLFDVHVHQKEFIKPKLFADMFREDWASEVVYVGNMNHTFIEAVREGKYVDGEGVVCKANTWSAKIKTNVWLNRLKHRYKQDWEKYE